MFIIDRFEGQMVVIEDSDKGILQIPRKLLPDEAQEGDVIKIIVDKMATRNRNENIQKLADELFE